MLNEIKGFKPNLIFMNGAIHHLDNDTMKAINEFIDKYDDTIFLSVDPVKKDNKLINKIMILLIEVNI